LVFFVDHLRTALALVLVSMAAITASADKAAMPQAATLLLRGKYAEAADLYSSLAKKNPAAAVGLARCLAAQGKDDAAEKSLAAAPGNDAGVLAERAAQAFAHGKADDARKWAEQAIRRDRDQLLARWIVAESDRTAGRLDRAQRGYHWLVNYYNDHDEMSAEQLHWIGLGAAQWARWTRQADQFQFLVHDLYPDALKQDPNFWPAHYEAGMLYLEKHNRGDAAREFQAALEINPNAAEAHVGLAAAWLEERQVEKVEASLTRALEINPRLLDGWLLKADLLWANFQVAEALALLEQKALPLNPTSEETLGRIAACYLLLDKTNERFNKLAEQVTKRNPHAGEFYFAIANPLRERNKQAEAEKYFREAIRVMPRQVGPEAELGLLYMSSGREDEARRALHRAFAADPFNVRVKNSLEVLDVLNLMQTLDSGRFAIKYNGEYDKLLARYATRHVAGVLPKLCRRFGYTPPGKTLIEVFNRSGGLDGHQWFSARMVGLPYIGTIAASTGYMVAMASPNEPDGGPHVNWAEVLTHELVHVVTLQQTRFNCPHWYTEGLAVWCQCSRRPDAWNELLRDRLKSGKLFTLDTLNFGFARPQSGGDWHLAYCQSELFVEYMLVVQPSRLPKKAGETPAPQANAGKTPTLEPVEGEETLRQMLAAYTDGLDTPEAIHRVFGVSQAQFEHGYMAFLKREMEKGLKSPIARLRKAAEDHPTDAAAAAALAEADHDDLAIRKKLVQMAVDAKDYAAAERWATEGIDIDVMDAALHRVVAESAAKRHNYTKAVEEYETAVELKPDDSKLQLALAETLVEAKQPAKAREVLQRLLKRSPGDPGAKKLLGNIK
jgi:tetratricopeptide (TPR) repeat protein